MTSKPDNTQARSLVPEIRQQEEQLLAELEKARSEAAQLKAEAERAADTCLSDARKELPKLVTQIREEGVAKLETALQEEQSSAQEDIASLENSAQQNLPKALKHLLSLVLGSQTP